MTIKYPKLHNRAFSMVTMSLLAVSCLAYGQELGQNDRKQENIESQKNYLSIQEFVDQIDKIITQKEPLTLDEYNEILSAFDGFPKDIKDFFQSEQNNLSQQEFMLQITNLLTKDNLLSDQQLLDLLKITKSKLTMLRTTKSFNKKHWSLPGFFMNFYPVLAVDANVNKEVDVDISVTMAKLASNFLASLKEDTKSILEMENKKLKRIPKYDIVSIDSQETYLHIIERAIRINLFKITNLLYYASETGDYSLFLEEIIRTRANYDAVYFPGTKDSLDKIDKYIAQRHGIQ